MKEYDSGEDGIQPHNFVTIGGDIVGLASDSLMGVNNVTKQFDWMKQSNQTEKNLERILSSAQYQTSDQSTPSAHQLVINTFSSKFKIIFLNDALPPPPGKIPIDLQLLQLTLDQTMINQIYILPFMRNLHSTFHILKMGQLGKTVLTMYL